MGHMADRLFAQDHDPVQVTGIICKMCNHLDCRPHRRDRWVNYTCPSCDWKSDFIPEEVEGLKTGTEEEYMEYIEDRFQNLPSDHTWLRRTPKFIKGKICHTLHCIAPLH